MKRRERECELRLILDGIIQSMDESPCTQQISDSIGVLALLHGINRVVCHAYDRWFREIAKEKMAQAAKNKDFRSVRALKKAIEGLMEVCKATDFDTYMLYMEWERPDSKRFYQPRRKVLYDAVVKDLQDLFDDRITMLGVSMPPRVGKSTICIMFLTFVMGNNPTACSLMVGYNDALAQSFYTEALSIVTDEEYRFAEVFPDAPFIDKSAEYRQIALKENGRYKTLTCASVDAGLTGRVEIGPGGLLYCDDLVKKREEAISTNQMDKLYNAYLNQVKDRTLPGAKFLMVGTRWVPNDPIGRVEAFYEGDERYRFVRCPALDENGESNFLYDSAGTAIPFTKEYYEDQMNSLIDAGEEDSWSAKYMCNPFWREGRLFEASELNYYESLPEGEPDAIMAATDTKTKGPDYCVQVICAVYGNLHYVIDVVCSDSVMDVLTPILAERLCRHRADIVRYESNVAGGSVATEVEKICKNAGWPVSIERKYSTANKETRIEVDSGWIKQNCLFLTDEKRDQEYRKFMQMLTSYSAKGKNAHDDVPDCMSMYKRLAASAAVIEVEVIDRPW